MNENIKQLFKASNDAMTRATIDRRLTEIYNTYPSITIARHNVTIFKAGGEFMGDPFYWNNEKTLKKIEQYQKQLSEQYNRDNSDFDDEPLDEEFLNERVSNNPKLYGKK